MKKDKRPFNGSFIKHKKYTAYGDLRKNGFDVMFDEASYNRAGKEIVDVLGIKERYTIYDVAEFFQSKYGAYRIPFEYALWYEDPFWDIAYDSREQPIADSMRPFDYSSSSGEKNITLVVDTVYNKTIRLKYPEIEKLENQRTAKSSQCRILRCNPIIIIGYKKSDILNSMCRCNNFQLIDGDGFRESIPDIDYEMWYFYKHS